MAFPDFSPLPRERTRNETLFSRALRRREIANRRGNVALPCASNFKRMLMIANDLGEMAVVVESNGILYEAIIDPLS